MNRKTMFVLAAVVLGAAVILYVSTSDYPAQPDDVVGTIGTGDGDRIAGVEQAQRYRTQQIGDEAVTLDNPEIQELLQDDEVIRLIQNPEFQRAMASEELRRALMSESLQRAVLQAEFSTALGRFEAQKLDATSFNRQELQQFANRIFPNADLARLVMENESLAKVFISNEPFALAVAGNEAFARELLASQDLQRMFSNVDAVSAMANLQRTGLISTAAFQRIVLSPEAFSLMATSDQRDDFFGRAARGPESMAR